MRTAGNAFGAVWNADGGHTFYATERHGVREAVLVDTDVTPRVLERAKNHPGLRIIEGNFADASMPGRVGNVDGVFFFDVLLHQVSPDWSDMLQRTARVLLVFNQQFTNLPRTTRLLDLGRDGYFRNVPVGPNEEPTRHIFEIWMPFIRSTRSPTATSIISGSGELSMPTLSVECKIWMQLYKNCGQFGQLKNVENHAFLFSR